MHVFFQRISILTGDSNTSIAMCLTNVANLENSALILFFSVLVDASFSRLAWVRRTFHVVDSFDKNTRFQGHGAYSSGESLRNSENVSTVSYADLIHTDIAIFTLVSCMVAELREPGLLECHRIQRSRSIACLDMSMVCQSGMEIF